MAQLSTNGPQGAMQQQVQGTEQAGHPHLPVGASSQGSSPATPPRTMTAAHGHGRSSRKRNKGNLARSATCGAQAPRKRVGPHASSGPGVPTPGCLRQRGSRPHLRWPATRVADIGVLGQGSASMARWAPGDEKASKGQDTPHVCTHRQLGSRRSPTADPEPGSATGSATRVRRRQVCRF